MKSRTSNGILVLSLILIFLAGCTGGGSALTDEQMVNKVLDSYESAMLSGNADKLASLLVYPIQTEEGYYATQNEAKEAFQFGFLVVDIKKFEFAERQISFSGGEAIVEMTKKVGTVTFGFADEYEESAIYQLKKIGTQWKIIASQIVE